MDRSSQAVEPAAYSNPAHPGAGDPGWTGAFSEPLGICRGLRKSRCGSSCGPSAVFGPVADMVLLGYWMSGADVRTRRIFRTMRIQLIGNS